jgi:hypothetical protein
VSPILVRPVREQLEHDRVIRLLPARYKRRFEVGINPGGEQNASVGAGPTAVFPDAVLYSPEKNRRVLGVVEVETVESVNHLEAMAEWAVYGRLKVPFHLYVPVAALDVARRLSSDQQVVVAEIWSFDNVGDQVRFTLVHKDPAAEIVVPHAPRPVVAKAAKAAAPAKPQAQAPSKPAAKPQPSAKPQPVAKPQPLAKAAAKPEPVARTAAKPTRPAVKPAPKASKPASKTAAKPASKAPVRKAARKAPRAAAKPAAKRASSTVRGRAVPARKATSAPKHK